MNKVKDKNGKTFGIGSVSFGMVKVLSGTFWMGDNNSEYGDEKPAHKVKLDDFYIGKYQVTQELWYEVMKDTDIVDPSRFKGKNRPVESVSWNDAVRFCNMLSELKNLPVAYDASGNYIDVRGRKTRDIREVKGFRLPTEAEWEYAAIGGHRAKKENGIHIAEYKYAGSNRLKEVGWYEENSLEESKDVGLKLPNQLGLFDMSGNVYERCGDWYIDDYYKRCFDRGVVDNPVGPDTGSSRVYRRGSWLDYAVDCRVAYRNYWDAVNRNCLVGFRLALSF